MRILFIGDVVGKPGRTALLRHLDELHERHALDLVVVNAENAAGGFGITRAIADDFFERRIDILTTGNHVWDKREALDFIEDEPRLLRPQNYPPGTPGRGFGVATSAGGVRLGVLNVMGTVFMHPVLDCPFRCVDETLERHARNVDLVLVDFHAEASSEKTAMGWYLDGRVCAVVGSHTHVPTADERVLPGGTAFISDAGMTGCYDSVIGMETESVLRRFVTKVPERMEVASGPGTVCGVVISVDEASGLSLDIERVVAGEKTTLRRTH